MDNTRISGGEWIRQWLGMLDRRHPGWGRAYDQGAFALAVEDVLGQAEVGEPQLEALGNLVQEAGVDPGLAADPGWRKAMIEFEYIFRVDHGSSHDDPSLRALRAETLRRLVEAARRPVEKRLRRIARALDMRERRRARRQKPLLPTADPRAPAPEVVVQAREAAWRTSLRAARDLPPATLQAVRRYVRGDGPASAVARACGVSPATLSRALRRLGEIAIEELEGYPDGLLRPFTSALVGFLGEF
ncbi:MAG TPA: hypothetical protein VEJ18_19855 [Planctomycetota bacterium]|nr:hypothetical protein [Planctomycetota bacterium]